MDKEMPPPNGMLTGDIRKHYPAWSTEELLKVVRKITSEEEFHDILLNEIYASRLTNKDIRRITESD